MYPNRVVAVAAAVLTLALAVLPVVGNFDWTSTAGVVAGIIAVLKIVDRFLVGWQAHEARQSIAQPSVYSASSAAALLKFQAEQAQASSDAPPPLNTPATPPNGEPS